MEKKTTVTTRQKRHNKTERESKERRDARLADSLPLDDILSKYFDTKHAKSLHDKLRSLHQTLKKTYQTDLHELSSLFSSLRASQYEQVVLPCCGNEKFCSDVKSFFPANTSFVSFTLKKGPNKEKKASYFFSDVFRPSSWTHAVDNSSMTKTLFLLSPPWELAEPFLSVLLYLYPKATFVFHLRATFMQQTASRTKWWNHMVVQQRAKVVHANVTKPSRYWSMSAAFFIVFPSPSFVRKRSVWLKS